MANIQVTRVSHSFLLIELGLICNRMESSLCFKSCEDHSLLKSYNGGIWKTFTGLGPTEFDKVVCRSACAYKNVLTPNAW